MDKGSSAPIGGRAESREPAQKTEMAAEDRKMVGLLTGLSCFGLGALENMDLYGKPGEPDKNKEEKGSSKAPAAEEQDYLFGKTYQCPVCSKEFKARTVKSGKARLIGSDADLRPKYENVDALKYDVILCPRCGYAALSRYFKNITSTQARFIKEKISVNFRPMTEEKETYTYDETLARYKLALLDAIVKLAKPSEKAYICLKTAWILRGKGEHLDKEDARFEEEKKKIEEEENEFLRNAYDGFLAARQSEHFPLCGMDEPTVDYLIAVMAVRFGQLEVAAKLVASVLASPGVNSRMKDRARELKEEIMKQVKKRNAAKA